MGKKPRGKSGNITKQLAKRKRFPTSPTSLLQIFSSEKKWSEGSAGKGVFLCSFKYHSREKYISYILIKLGGLI